MSKEEELYEAARLGQTSYLEALIKEGADIHFRNDRPLALAIENDDIRAAKLLIENGADINAHNRHFLTVVAEVGSKAMVELLLDHGADIHANNDSALCLAAGYGRTEIVQILLDHGADVHANDDEPLRKAAESGYKDTAQSLIQNGADENILSLKLARGISGYSVTDPARLRMLCIRQNWFTCGSNEQYEKMFYANDNGWPIEDIATAIWICSKNVDRDTVLNVLREEREYYLNPPEPSRNQEMQM